MQTMCAYETDALGYSAFCPLFTQAEWEGFEYAWDIYFWYNSGFGSPVARAQGSGYVLELLSRLTHTVVTANLTSNPSLFSLNTTLDNDSTTFPLNNALYSDATHEVVMINVYAALNLTVLARDGPLSATKMKRNRSWVSSRVAPFGSNMQIQILSCGDSPTSTSHTSSTTYTSSTTTTSSGSTDNVRIIINDGVVSLKGLQGCPAQKDGLCPLDTFVASQKKLVEKADWEWACCGSWRVPAGDDWVTTTGDPPPKSP